MAFEDEKDEEYWKELAEEKGEELGVDTREGSVYMDMQTGHCIRVAKFYDDLDSVKEMLAFDTCTDDILDEKAGMDNVFRVAATSSCWTGIFEGATPPEGTEFMCEDYYFTLTNIAENLYLVANEPGTATNSLKSGSELIPLENIDDLEAATLGELMVPGTDKENDDTYRERWRKEKATPSSNNNKPQYKKWCEEVDGIGRARIFPLWGGPNTVKAVLFSDAGQNVLEELVDFVQEYIDPIELGYEVEVNGTKYIFGDGVGEGVSNLGAHFLAESAKPLYLTISAEVDLLDGYTLEMIQSAAANAITTYLSGLCLNSSDTSQTVVRIATIGSIIANIEGVLDYDYDTLMINESGENILVDMESVAVLSEVIFVANT